MFSRKIRASIFVVIFGVVLISIFNNCSMRKPQLTNRSIASATYFHTGTEKNCLPCHDGSRPLFPVGPSYTFDHVSQEFGGGGDCVSCHQSQTTWAGGHYKHNPQPKTCFSCHEAQRPMGTVGATSFDHKQNGMGDCFGCHAQSTTQYNSMSDWAGAHAMPSDLIGNKKLSVSVGVPVFSNTTITKVNETKQTLPLQMLHSSNQIPSSIISKCENCHVSARANDYTQGIFHKSLDQIGAAAPAACSSCHINAAPSGFVGAMGSGRNPASAEMRHEAVVWLADVDGKWKPSSEKIIKQDCSVCHADTVGDNWGEASLHASLKATNQAQPTSCLSCHANNRPEAGLRVSKFDHSKSGGMGDCLNCHKNAEKNNFRSWVGTAEFSHKDATSCSSCHEEIRPNSTTGWTQAGWSMAKTTFQLSAHAVGTDCVSCHEKSITGGNPSAKSDWQGGNYKHNPKPANCANCHTIPTSEKLPDLTGLGISYKDHSGYQGQDCVGCHNKAPNYSNLSGWTGVSEVPLGLVNGVGFDWNFWSVDVYELKYQNGASLSTATLTKKPTKLPQQILHSSAQVPTSLLGDCKSCHTNGTSSNSGTKFHSNVALANIKTCNECHAQNGRPVGIVGDGAPTMNHQVVSNTECLTCHKSNIGTSWKTGAFHENIADSAVTTCLQCHIPSLPKNSIATEETYTPVGGSAIPQHFSHQAPSVKQDCSTCHSRATSDTDWATQIKFHSLVPANTINNCSGCHLEDVSKTASYPIGEVKDKYVHSPNFSSKDCLSCHATATGTWVMNSSGTLKTAPASYSNVGVTWSNAFYDHVAPNGDSVGSCGSCHNSGGFYKHSRVQASERNRPCNTCH